MFVEGDILVINIFNGVNVSIIIVNINKGWLMKLFVLNLVNMNFLCWVNFL